MAYQNVDAFIKRLEEEGELYRVKVPVSTVEEMTEINDRIIKTTGKALLFENTGYDFPVLLNAMGSEKRISLALGVERLEEIGDRIAALLEMVNAPQNSIWDKLRLLPKLKEVSTWMPSKGKGKGACQEFEMEEVDLNKLPVLTCWPHDGGPFITFPAVHTKGPDNGIHNMGMYRMQVFDKQSTGMHWHLHKGGAAHYEAYKAKGEKMPVTVTLGGDMAYTYAATAPMPENMDEFMLAGFFRQKKVKLVKSLTNDIWIPEDVDFVLEGYVDPSEEKVVEGPFGDHTGYYSLADLYPTFHVTKITHRKNAVYPATIVGIPPQEDAWIGLATERIFLNPIKMTMVPEIVDMHMPAEGVFHNIVFSSIKTSYPGQAHKVVNALWGAGQMMFNKLLFVFDEETVLSQYTDLLKRVSDYTHPIDDVYLGRGPLDVLDHASQRFAVGGKMGFDATRKTIADSDEAIHVDIEAMKNAFSQIEEVDSSFTTSDIRIVLIRLSKTAPQDERAIAKKCLDEKWMTGIRYVVFVEAVAPMKDLGDIVWRVANNLDPARDCFYISQENQKPYPTLFMDGSRKTKEFDGFEREWPNIVTTSEEIIKKVDERWEEYQIGKFLDSPSKKYIKQLYPGGAVAE